MNYYLYEIKVIMQLSSFSNFEYFITLFFLNNLNSLIFNN